MNHMDSFFHTQKKIVSIVDWYTESWVSFVNITVQVRQRIDVLSCEDFRD